MEAKMQLGLVCDNAECCVKIVGDEFDKEDPYYSNQGQAGTCVRHALAKAIIREVSGWTKKRINLSIDCIVTALLNARSDLGARGARVMDWDKTKGTIQGKGGHIYTYELSIVQYPDKNMAHIATVDLRNVLPDQYKHHKERQGHAMFCEFNDGDYLILRNSWGKSFEKIRVHKSEKSLETFYVHVKDLIWQKYGKRQQDIYIIKNFNHDYNGEWPNETN